MTMKEFRKYLEIVIQLRKRQRENKDISILEAYALDKLIKELEDIKKVINV